MEENKGGYDKVTISIAVKILLGILWGWLLHFTYKPTLYLSPGLCSMVRSAIGVIGMTPFVLVFSSDLKEDVDDDNKRTFLAMILSALSLGIGVFVGHAIDYYKGEE